MKRKREEATLMLFRIESLANYPLHP